MKICYAKKKFNAEHQLIVDRANAFIFQYQQQGYTLTLRQLYYRFIATDLFPDSWIDEAYNLKNGLAASTKNTVKNYKRLGGIISDARRAGAIDWDAIEDRTRTLRTQPSWSSPASIVRACADQYDVDFWADQSYRPEVCVEKDALIGVLEPVCRELHVPYFSTRGYTSDSTLQEAAQRLARYDTAEGKVPIVFHLGDHDPSGIDMSRDVRDRIALFSSNTAANSIEVRRIALNKDQIEQYDPPPNPAKATDARYGKYEEIHGDESWELDALDPDVIADIVRDHIRELIDQDAWEEAEARRDEGRAKLDAVARKWAELTAGL